MDERARSGWKETAGVAVIVYAALVLPFHGVGTSRRLAAFVLVSTALGTLVGRRRPTQGPWLERLLHRSAVAAVVAALVLAVLISTAL